MRPNEKLHLKLSPFAMKRGPGVFTAGIPSATSGGDDKVMDFEGEPDSTGAASLHIKH